MKKLLAVVLLVSCCSFAGASPYFRLLDPAHPRISAGAFLDPTSGVTDYGSMVALVTHHPRDGSVTGANAIWTPLAVGGGYGHGQGFMALGPSCNIAPVVKAFLLKGLDLVTNAERYPSLKELLAPKKDGEPDITLALGPSFMFNVVEGGAFVAPDRWRLQTRIFAGAAWAW